MTGARKLVHGSALRVASFFASALTALVMMPFVVHSIGDSQYGIWALVAGYVGYYGLLDFGLLSAVTRYFAAALVKDDRKSLNQVFNTALVLYAGLGSMIWFTAALAAFLMPCVVKDRSSAVLARNLILILGCNFGISFPLRVFVGLLNANLRFDITAGFELANLVLRTAMVIAFIKAGFMVTGLAWASLLATLLLTLMYLVAIKSTFPMLALHRRSISKAVALSLFSYGSSSFVINIADLLRFQMDSIVVASFVGVAAVTHFSLGSNLVQCFISVIGAIFGVLMPVFSRQQDASDRVALKRTYLLATRMCVAVTSFVAFGLIAWGRCFIVGWMGAPYSDGYPVLVILTVASTVALWQSPSIQLLYGLSKHRFYASMALAEGIANLVLSILLARNSACWNCDRNSDTDVGHKALYPADVPNQNYGDK